MRVYVNYKKNTIVTREKDPNERWDADDTSSSYEILGLVLSSNDCSFLSERVDIDFEVKAGDQYYLLYAVYSTGSSFGKAEDGCIEFIDLYKTEEKANLAYDKVCKEAKTSVISIPTEGGNTHDLYVPWNGYFESLSYVELKPISLLMYKRKEF